MCYARQVFDNQKNCSFEYGHANRWFDEIQVSGINRTAVVSCVFVCVYFILCLCEYVLKLWILAPFSFSICECEWNDLLFFLENNHNNNNNNNNNDRGRERGKREYVYDVYKTAKQSIYGLSSFMFDRINLLLAQFVNLIYVLSVFMFTQNAHITSHSSRTATAFWMPSNTNCWYENGNYG